MSARLVEAVLDDLGWCGVDESGADRKLVTDLLAVLREHPDLLLAQLVEWGVLREKKPTRLTNGGFHAYDLYTRGAGRVFVAPQQEEREQEGWDG